MPSPDVSKIKFLPKKLSLVYLVGANLPKGILAKQVIKFKSSSEDWVSADPLLKADLVVINDQKADVKSLAKKIAEATHEAGAVFIASDNKPLSAELKKNNFKSVEANLFQKSSGTTPEEYGQEYIDRWGNNDWMANAKMEADQILEHLPKGLKKSEIKVLDVGCLNGYILEAVRRGGVKHVYGTDISYFLAVEKQINPELLPAITIGDFSVNNYPSNYFEMVICMEVLEHIPPQMTSKFIKELKRVTAKNGVILISTSEDWKADETHVNCRGRFEWYFEFAKKGLAATGSQVIFPGFNSFVVKRENNPFKALTNLLLTGLKFARQGRIAGPETK